MVIVKSLGKEIEKLVHEAMEKLEKAKIDKNHEFRRKAALNKLYEALGYIKAR
ncbi:hypothetical protein ES707_03828 [subsurface metagenome]